MLTHEVLVLRTVALAIWFPWSRVRLPYMALCVLLALCWLPAVAQEITVTPPSERLTERLQAEAAVLSADESASSSDLLALAKGDYARLLAVLYEAGYFGARVSIQLAGREAAGLRAFEAPAELRPISVTVDTGPRFTFGRADVAPLAPGAAPPQGFRPGADAGTAVIRETAQDAVADWRAASHAKARVSGQSIVARHDEAELDVALAVDPGPALSFGTLVVPQESGVRPARVRRIAGLPEGAPFGPEELARVRARLVNTGTFSSVVLREAEVPNPDGTLDVELALEAEPARRIGFGAEIDSTNGASLQAFWLHRNFFGGAERLRFDGEIEGIGGTSGGIDYALAATLRIPGFRRADDTFEFSVGLERLDEPSFEENLLEVSARVERQVRDTLVIGTQAGLRFSDVTDAFGSREFSHIVLTFDGEQDFRDDALDPRRGSYTFVELRPFVGIAGSETGLRVSGEHRRYLALGENTTLAGRLQLGSVLGTDTNETPPDFRFFSGGGGTVRGQGFQSLGVESANGTTGGRSFAGLSLEVRRDISESIGVVGFVDYGYIAENGEFEDGSDHTGAGIGLRYRTALGPLRVDVGVPVGGSSDGTNYGIYISLGQTF